MPEYEYSYIDDDVPPGWWDECRVDLDAPECFCKSCKADRVWWQAEMASGRLARDIERDKITADIASGRNWRAEYILENLRMGN